MTIEEIERYLAVSSSHSVCVTRDTMATLNGYVRSIYFIDPNVVQIEVEPYGFDEAGIYAHATYSSLSNTISIIEKYIQQPLEEWHNYNRLRHIHGKS